MQGRARGTFFALPWAGAFIANLLVSLVLPFRFTDTPYADLAQFFSSLRAFELTSGLRVALQVSLVVTVVHVLYAFFFSNFYIRFSLLVMIVEAVASFVFMLFNISQLPTLYVLFAPLALLGAGIWFLFAWRRLAPKSVALMKASVSVITSNPGLLLTQAVNFAISALGIVYYGGCIALTVALEKPLWFTAYFVFSGFWLYATLGYMQLVITAGVTHSFARTGRGSFVQNFLKGAVYMIGSAAFCGLLVALLRTLRWVLKVTKPGKKKNDDDDEEEKGSAWIKIAQLVLYYIAKAILNVLIRFAEHLSRNTLIYCAVFNEELALGWDRFASSGIEHRINALDQESMISIATTVNSVFMTLLAAGLAAAIGWLQGLGAEPLAAIAGEAAVVTLVMSIGLISVIKDTTDTMFLCFALWPETQKRLAPDS